MPGMLRAAVCAVLLLAPAAVARADTLDDVRARGTIRWGGDQEGGGPYIYPRRDDPSRVAGFEVGLMDLLAARLAVRPEFKQGEWDKLLDLVRRRDIDIVVNGYELTASRLQRNLATIPYYIYELQLLARRNDASIRSWEDLKTQGGRRKKVGVLGGSSAETYVRDRLGEDVDVRLYTGSTDAMIEVQNGRLDATVQDLPPAIYYRNRFRGLDFVGPPVGPGYYVIYLRAGDERLRDELNAGLLDIIHNGKLRALYERYGLWNATQEKLGTPGLGLAAVGPDLPVIEQSEEAHGWAVVRRNLPLLLQAAWMTVRLTCEAMPLAIIAGLLVALGRLYGPAPLRWLSTGYVEFLRGTPLLIQLFTIYYVLPPALGISLNPITAAIVGLAINYSAYEAENYRAGLLAIPTGQLEAALSLGMSRAVALRRVIVPQAVRIVIPPVTNDFIALFKDTSICSIITVVELSKRYSILVNSTNAYLELAAVTAFLYLLMSYPLSLLSRRLERRFPRVAV